MPKAPIPDYLVAEVKQDGFTEYFLHDEVFHSGIFLLIGDVPKEKYTEWARIEFNCPDQTPYHGKHAWASPVEMEDGDLRTVMVMLGAWKNTREQHLTLQHECHHATTYQLHHIGLTHSRETEEVWTYFQESIVRRFLWALEHPKQTIPCPRRKQLVAQQKRRLAKKPRST